MSVDELRAGFDRLTRDVVPINDPYGRLLMRRNRRLRTRIGAFLAACAAAVAAALLAPLALQTAGQPIQEGFPIASAWARQHLEAPTRGNMPDAAVAELADYLADEGRDQLRVSDGLAHTKVLFTYEHDDMWQAVVAYHSDTHAVVFARSAALSEPVQALFWRDGAEGIPLSPFIVGYSEIDAVKGAYVGLPPTGCQVGTSLSGSVSADGDWQRGFPGLPEHSYVINHNAGPAEVWQVTCAGEVRELRPARPIHETVGTSASLGGGGPGSVDDDVAMAAGYVNNSLRFATGVGDTHPWVIWGGPVPGMAAEGPGVLIGPPGGAAGIITLTFGKAFNSLVALEPAGSSTLPLPQDPRPGTAYSLTSTGVADGSGAYVIRIPRREAHRAVLSEHVLLVGPAGATRAEARTAAIGVIAAVPLTRGVGKLRLAVGAADTIHFLDAEGNEVAYRVYTAT